MSFKAKTALLPPACEEAPAPGMPLVVGRQRRISATQGLSGNAIQAGALEARHGLIPNDVLFGEGEDGEVVFDGTNAATLDDGTSFSPSSGVYSITRDINAHTMHVMAGADVRPVGVRLCCLRLVLYGSGKISRNGSNGGNATGATGGTKGGVPAANVLGGAGSGQDGSNGGTAPSQNGTAGVTPSGVVNSLGGGGGDSGAGGAGAGPGGSGGGGAAAATATAPAARTRGFNLTTLKDGTALIYGGAGGSGGGGGGASSGGDDGGGGGAGGSGGGVILVAAKEIILVNWTGTIEANGGNGGDGANGAAGNGGGGGGGGPGGGGFVQVIYRSVSGGSLLASPATRNGLNQVSGANVTAHAGTPGGGGTGANSGANGNLGFHGWVVIVDLSARPAPKSMAGASPSFVRPAYRKPALHAGHYYAMRRTNQTY